MWLEQKGLQGVNKRERSKEVRGRIKWRFVGVFQVQVPYTSYPIILSKGSSVCVCVCACMHAPINSFHSTLEVFACSNLKAKGPKQLSTLRTISPSVFSVSVKRINFYPTNQARNKLWSSFFLLSQAPKSYQFHIHRLLNSLHPIFSISTASTTIISCLASHNNHVPALQFQSVPFQLSD